MSLRLPALLCTKASPGLGLEQQSFSLPLVRRQQQVSASSRY